MVHLWLRHDARLFGVIFVVFNVLLAVFNILNYRVTSRTSVPCVVIVAPTASSAELVEQGDSLENKLEPERVIKDSVSSVKQKSNTPPLKAFDYPNGTTTPSTRILSHSRTNNTVQNSSTTPTTQWETEVRDKYMVIKNYIPADYDPPEYDGSVTLTTQGTYEFLDHVQVLCQRWDGPVSVSVYAPGTDLPVAVRKILYLRQCGPSCVSTNVSWHIIYDAVLGPTVSQLEPANETAEMDVYAPLLNCSAGTVDLDLVSEIRKAKKMGYPINVARNVARQQAHTRYVLASDIELYPSLNIVSRFLKLVAKPEEKDSPKHVYTLPIFEIKKDLPAPVTKTELIKRVNNKEAIFFHKWVCDACQSFPKRDEWLKFLPSNDSLSVFLTTKRQSPRTAWEPIYIGTNSEPFYDERLTWEGKRDKMSQMYELCLMDYDFKILDNAFLVHAPGIKTMNMADQQRRAPYMVKNNAVHNKLLAQMRKKYGGRRMC